MNLAGVSGTRNPSGRASVAALSTGPRPWPVREVPRAPEREPAKGALVFGSGVAVGVGLSLAALIVVALF